MNQNYNNGGFEPELYIDKDIFACIVFSVVSLGIYYLYWVYKIMRKIHILNGEYPDSGLELLCYALVPFYDLYWFYTRTTRLAQGLGRRGFTCHDNGVLNIILTLLGFPIIGIAIMQDDLNHLANSRMY